MSSWDAKMYRRRLLFGCDQWLNCGDCNNWYARHKQYIQGHHIRQPPRSNQVTYNDRGLKCIIHVWFRLKILAGILRRLTGLSDCTVLGLRTITNELDKNSIQLGIVYAHPHTTPSMIRMAMSMLFVLLQFVSQNRLHNNGGNNLQNLAKCYQQVHFSFRPTKFVSIV